MGKRKFNDEQIMDILKERQVGMRVADVCRKYGISEPTFYRWQSVRQGRMIDKDEAGSMEKKKREGYF